MKKLCFFGRLSIVRKGFIMKTDEIQQVLADFDVREFTSSAHTSQHRLFGFTTTNIRTPKTFSDYIGKLLPEYLTRKDNLDAWEQWTADPNVQQTYKQMFKRLEIAKILFRKVKDSPHLNDIGIKLYNILEQDKKYLDFILYLYILSGRYFDTTNQPLVEIEKVINSYNGDIIRDAMEVLQDKNNNRLFFAMVFYNPAELKALDFAYELLQNKNFDNDGIRYLQELVADKDSIIAKRITTAGSIGNFRSDVATVLNYHLFKLAAQQCSDDSKYEEVIEKYIESVFDAGLNVYFGLENKEEILKLLLDKKNLRILKDIFEFASGIKFDNNLVRKRDRKNIKHEAFEKYGYKCFFDCFATDEQEQLAHELNYFHTKKQRVYLEGHHMVQMENSKFFEKDVDVVENIIPVCPNCHRKLHNANSEVVLRMLNTYYNNSNKKDLIRKGIFVDIDTLARFYGIEGD